MGNLKFKYKNYKGKVNDREVHTPRMTFTQSDFHGQEDQWFLEAYDVSKDAMRLFAVKDIIKFY